MVCYHTEQNLLQMQSNEIPFSPNGVGKVLPKPGAVSSFKMHLQCEKWEKSSGLTRAMGISGRIQGKSTSNRVGNDLRVHFG